jgi:hypothetical protein
VSEFRLNLLPLEVAATSNRDTVHRLERDSAAESKVRSLAEDDRGFLVYSFGRHTYVWPRYGRNLPSAVEAVEADQAATDIRGPGQLGGDLSASLRYWSKREDSASHTRSARCARQQPALQLVTDSRS